MDPLGSRYSILLLVGLPLLLWLGLFLAERPLGGHQTTADPELNEALLEPPPASAGPQPLLPLPASPVAQARDPLQDWEVGANHRDNAHSLARLRRPISAETTERLMRRPQPPGPTGQAALLGGELTLADLPRATEAHTHPEEWAVEGNPARR